VGGDWCRLNLAGKLAAASDNNFAELAAVYFTLLRHPINKRLTIHTDSMFVLHRVNGLLMPLGCALPSIRTHPYPQPPGTLGWVGE
jgi:hypothetical protein